MNKDMNNKFKIGDYVQTFLNKDYNTKGHVEMVRGIVTDYERKTLTDPFIDLDTTEYIYTIYLQQVGQTVKAYEGDIFSLEVKERKEYNF